MSNGGGLDYRAAGVDLDAAERTKEGLKALVASTRDANTLSELGAFGGLYAVPGDVTQPVLVSSADGVGTKLKVAFMTGRQPHRNGMGDTAVDISGFGLADKEVTLAEVLSDAGYNTVHIGKWHLGDIMETWPNHQGFDFAAFPIHQQGQLTVFNDDAFDRHAGTYRDARVACCLAQLLGDGAHPALGGCKAPVPPAESVQVGHDRIRRSRSKVCSEYGIETQCALEQGALETLGDLVMDVHADEAQELTHLVAAETTDIEAEPRQRRGHGAIDVLEQAAADEHIDQSVAVDVPK